MVVLDALAEPRFATNSLVTGDPFIRFYAGTPIVTNGHVLGTLCILDTEPHEEFPSESMELLERLAALTVMNIEQHKVKLQQSPTKFMASEF